MLPKPVFVKYTIPGFPYIPAPGWMRSVTTPCVRHHGIVTANDPSPTKSWIVWGGSSKAGDRVGRATQYSEYSCVAVRSGGVIRALFALAATRLLHGRLLAPEAERASG